MATASIRINQAANDTPTGVAGRSRDDITAGDVVQLLNADDTGVRSWRWRIVDRPEASTVTLSNPVSAAPTFTPDAYGSYLIELVVNEGRTGEVDRRVVAVRDTLGLRVPAAGEAAEANWLIGGEPNDRGYQPEFERMRLLLNDLQTQIDADPRIVVYEVSFFYETPQTISDGSVVLDDLTWTADNVANSSTFAVVDEIGIRITHDNGVATEISGADTAPQIRIPLGDLIPNYDPTHRYLFMVSYQWEGSPDEAGERFSIGFQSFAEAPYAGTTARFIGATSVFVSNDDGDLVRHEAEDTNSTTTVFAASDLVMAVHLLDGRTIETYSGDRAFPDLDELVPVAVQRSDDAEVGGESSLTHPDTWFTMALAATGTTATHSVAIEGLRIIRMV